MLARGLERIGISTRELQRVNWLRILLPLFAIVAAFWIGRNAPSMQVIGRSGFEGILVILVGIIAALLVLYRLELGIFAIVATSFLLRFTISTGTATAIPASMIVASFVVTVWLLSMLIRRQVKLNAGSYVQPALLFMLVSLISVPYSWLILRPDIFGQGGAGRSGLGFSFVQLGGVSLMILLPLVMLMAANVLKKEKYFKALFGLMVFIAIPELLQRFTFIDFRFGTFELKTGASYSLWLVALTMGQALFNDNLKIWQRAFCVALAGTWLYIGAELGATWFSGWMPAFVALMFLLFSRSRTLFFIVLAGALFLFALRPEFYIDKIWNDAVAYDSNRFEIWQVIIFDLTLTKTNIFLGAGPAGYLPFYETYYPGNAWVSHNNYVDIFAETGLIGFSIFLWLLFSVFKSGWEQRDQMPTAFLRGFNMGVLAGFVGTLFAMGLGDWYIPFVYNIGIPGFDFAVYGWLLSGAMLALRQLVRANNATDAAAAKTPVLVAPSAAR